MKILITAPSLDETQNVSGISTVVRQIINGLPYEFVHFSAGRRDGESRGISWLLRQGLLPLSFIAELRRARPDLVHINTAMTSAAIVRDAALTHTASVLGYRVVVFIHGGRFLLENITNRFVHAAASRMLRSAVRVIVLSDNEKAELLSRFPAIENIGVLPNAVPAADRVEAVRLHDGPPVILFLGRLHESKGIYILGDVLRRLIDDGREFRFECYGDGPERERFINVMNTAIGDRFFYGGVVSGKEKNEAIGRADIFVLPSLYGEGLPMAMLEAMAAGRVVVVSDMASTASVVNDGVNGYLVPPGDADALFAKLAGVLSARSDWPHIAGNAAATIRDNFAAADYFRQLEAIYQNAAIK